MYLAVISVAYVYNEFMIASWHVLKLPFLSIWIYVFQRFHLNSKRKPNGRKKGTEKKVIKRVTEKNGTYCRHKVCNELWKTAKFNRTHGKFQLYGVWRSKNWNMALEEEEDEIIQTHSQTARFKYVHYQSENANIRFTVWSNETNIFFITTVWFWCCSIDVNWTWLSMSANGYTRIDYIVDWLSERLLLCRRAHGNTLHDNTSFKRNHTLT